MKSTITSSVEKLEHIESYISSINTLNKLASHTATNEDSSKTKAIFENIRSQNLALRRKKIYEYTSIIISTYGVLENFIESIISSYIQLLNTALHDYSYIPHTIRENHFQLSAQLIKNLSKPKYNTLTTQEQIIINLHSCITNTNYKINHYAYIDHTANFRHDTVISSLKNIGIDDLSNKILSTENFVRHISKKYSISNIQDITNETLFSPLNDLAQRRNEVSHGQSFELLDHSYLLEIIEFVKEYCLALYNILQNEYLILISKYKSHLQIHPTKLFSNNIICFKSASGKIKLSDKVICKSFDNTYTISNIQSIHINKKSETEHTWSSETIICIQIDNKIKDNYILYCTDNALINIVEL